MKELCPQPPILRRRNNHIPYDIAFNILAKLPVKSVIRFRCVCKSWDSSITTPYFISTHLNHNNNKDRDNGYVIHKPSSPPTPSNIPVCTVAFDHTFDSIYEVRIPFDFSSDCAQIVGSCNGLLCLADFRSLSTGDNDIYLWNPSIRKFKKLPHTCLGKVSFVTLGFAYHSENNDYKVVRISYRSLSTPKIEVYTLSSDSWRRVEISLTANLIFRKNFYSPIPLISGSLYWFAYIKEENCRRVIIMAFDVNIEKFKKLALPDDCFHGRSLHRCLALFKGKLAFIKCGRNEQRDFQFSIWVMREYGVVESWDKLFVVPFQRVAYCIAFTEYGSLLARCVTRVKNQGSKFVLIDTETLHEKNPSIQCTSFVANFIESLVLLDGANVEAY